MSTLFLSLLLAAPASATEHEAPLKGCIYELIERESGGDDWRARSVSIHNLDRGPEFQRIDLQAGKEYLLMACGDTNVAELTLMVYDNRSSWRSPLEVAERTEESVHAFTFTPHHSGTYSIGVAATADGDAPADVSLGLAQR